MTWLRTLLPARPELRTARVSDIPAMHQLRLSVAENRLASDAVRQEHYIPYITLDGQGWVVEDNGEIVAFGICERDKGRIWALCVDPLREGEGFGRSLHDALVVWLWEQGVRQVLVSTEPDTRAERFYETAGWERAGVSDMGLVTYRLPRPEPGAGTGAAGRPG